MCAQGVTYVNPTRLQVWVGTGVNWRSEPGATKQRPVHPPAYSLMLTVRLAAFLSSWDTRACLALWGEENGARSR